MRRPTEGRAACEYLSKPSHHRQAFGTPFPGLWYPITCDGRARAVAGLGEAAALRFIDFFTANNSNPNTYAAYTVAVRGFFRWRARRTRGPKPRRRSHAPRLGLRRAAHTYLQDADGQTGPGGNPHAVRLADRRPDRQP